MTVSTWNELSLPYRRDRECMNRFLLTGIIRGIIRHRKGFFLFFLILVFFFLFPYSSSRTESTIVAQSSLQSLL